MHGFKTSLSLFCLRLIIIKSVIININSIKQQGYNTWKGLINDNSQDTNLDKERSFIELLLSVLLIILESETTEVYHGLD